VGVASFRCFDAQRSGCVAQIQIEQISKDVYGDVCADRGFQLGEDVPSAVEVGAMRGVSIVHGLFPEKPFLLVNLRLHPT